MAWHLLLAATLAAALAGCVASTIPPAPGPMGLVAFEPLGKCSGNLAHERTAQLASHGHLLAFWREACHAGEPRPPEVDFGRKDVLAVFVGARATTGFVVEVVEVVRAADHLQVAAVETQPGEGCAGGAAVTYPNVFVAVDKTGSPARFTMQRWTRACG